MVHAEWISAARDWRWEGDVEDDWEKRGRREIVGMDVKLDFSGGVGGWGIGVGFLGEDWGGGRGEEEGGGGGGGLVWVSSVMVMMDK